MEEYAFTPARASVSDTDISQYLPIRLYSSKSESSLLNSPSSDRELQFILKSPARAAFFLNFLCSNYSDENLMFWREVESLRELFRAKSTKEHLKRDSIPISDTTVNSKSLQRFDSATSALLKKRIEAIWGKYFMDSSRYRINVDHAIISKIKDELGDPPMSIYDAAQEFIYNLMRDDLLPKFLKSEMNLKNPQSGTNKDREIDLERSKYVISKDSLVFVHDKPELGTGIVRFIGMIPLSSSPESVKVECAGVAFHESVGDCDGTYNGIEYFKCEQGHGMILPLSMLSIQLRRDRPSASFSGVSSGLRDKLRRIYPEHRHLSTS